MGVGSISTRTDDSLGQEKANSRPIEDRTRQIEAGEYNRLVDKVIELQGAVGTSTSPAAASIEARMRCRTAATLAALPGPYDGAKASTECFQARGDGGGGEWVWDAGSSTTANNGTVLAATGGRWKRIVADVLNVRWFGARGDGATDDVAAIAAALAVAAALGGATVYFPPGTYIVSPTGGTSLTISASNITLLGSRGKSWIKHPAGLAGTSNAIITFQAANNITIKDLGFDGNWGATVGVTDTLSNWQASHAYVVGDKVRNLVVDTYRAYRCTTSGTSASSGGPTTTAASVTDGTVVWTYLGDGALDPCNHVAQVDPKNRMLMIRGCNDMLISKCLFKQAYGDFIWVGASAGNANLGATNIVVSDCVGDIAARNAFTFGQKCECITVSNCRWTNIYAQAFDVEPVGNFLTVRDVLIDHCYMDLWWSKPGTINSSISIVGASSLGGIDPAPGESGLARQFRVSNCTIIGSLSIYSAVDVVIENNRIICDFDGYSWAPILVDHYNDDIHILNNYIYHRTSDPGDVRGDAGIIVRDYGVHQQPAGVRIHGNRIHARNGRHGIVVQGVGGKTGDTGTAEGVTSSTLTDSDKSWTTNQWAGHMVRVGTSHASIQSNTGTVLTLGNWSTPLGESTSTPAAGAYTILSMGGVVDVSENMIECTNDGRGAGGFGIYLYSGDFPNSAGADSFSRVRVHRNTIKNATTNAIDVVGLTENPWHHLEITDNLAFDNQVTPTCTNVVKFESSPAIAFTRLIMRGNVAGLGVTNAVSGLTTEEWLLHGGSVESWAGYGAPAMTAPVGSTYSRLDGGAGTSFYVRESGGWVAK